jgi:hypothetical protein
LKEEMTKRLGPELRKPEVSCRVKKPEDRTRIKKTRG